MRNIKVGEFHQINKRSAKKMFAAGELFFICDSVMRPGPPWNPECGIGPDSIEEWKRRAAFYAPDGITPSDTLWEGSIDETAWSLFCANWASYNLPTKSSYPRYYKIVTQG